MLLSAHACPLGSNFMKSTIKAFQDNDNLAGIRYINSLQDVRDNLVTPQIKQPLKRGMMNACLLYTSPSPRDQRGSRMPSSA